MRTMNRPFIALTISLACTAAIAAEKAPQSLRFELAAAKVHEECFRLEAGDERKYQWKSNAPVDFNIHYHKGSEVFYPVKRNLIRGDDGTFTAKTGEDYCLMWTAKEALTLVEGEIR